MPEEHIPLETVRSICKMGQGSACCSFLLAGMGGFVCAKAPGREGVKATLDARRQAGSIGAMGDNCFGWPPPAVDDRVPLDKIFFVSPRRKMPDGSPEPEDEWAKRCGVIYNVGAAKTN